MKYYPIWPHRLVLTFTHGRWATFLLIFGLLLLLFRLASERGGSDLFEIQLFFSFVIAYSIPASHYVSEQNLAALDSLKPVLNLDEKSFMRIRESLTGNSVFSQLVILGIGCLLGIAHNYLLLTADTNLLSALQDLDTINVLFLFITIFLWCLLTVVISNLIDNVRAFARLAKNNTRIDLLNGANLRGYSRVAVYSTLVLLGVLATFPLLLMQTGTNYLTILPGFLATFIPMMSIFLIPLLPIRAKIKSRKSEELASIQHQINQITGSHDSLIENDAALQRLQPLLDYRREVHQVPEWPFDSPAFFRLMFYLFIPPLTWVGAALIERLVDTVQF